MKAQTQNLSNGNSRRKSAATCLILLALFGLIQSATAQTFTVLHTFSPLNSDTNDDGANPSGGLTWWGGILVGTATDGGRGGVLGGPGGGTAFAIDTTNGSGFQVLYNFEDGDRDGGTGCFPADPLLALSGSAFLYGTTSAGGNSTDFPNGTVFGVNPVFDEASFTVLHTFTKVDPNTQTNDDGANPYSGLVLSSNILYGTADEGGSGGNGTVFTVGSDGTGFTVLHAFSAGGTNSDGAYPHAGLVLSGETLYGTAIKGGSGGSGVVFEINTDGTGFGVLHSFPAVDTNLANGDGAYPYGALILSGNVLYGTTGEGGKGGSGTVFKLNTDGSGFTVLYSFSSIRPGTNSDGAYPIAGLALTNNQLFGTTSAGGTGGAGTIFVVGTNGTGFSVLHQFATPDPTNEANSDGAFPFAGLLLLGDSVFGTAQYGGVAGNGTVFKLSISNPSLAIANPRANSHLTNADVAVEGTATSQGGVASVFYELNGGGWTEASSTNGWTNWTAFVTGTPGTNVVRAYALNKLGNSSLTNSVSFVYVQYAPLQVNTNGLGTISPNYNGKSLQVGNAYTMTAKPQKGFGFTGWTGSIVTNSAKLTFHMQPDLVLTANFVDIQRPICAITYPKSQQHITNDVITITGKAGDNVAVQSVRYELNNSGWTGSATTNSWTNWAAQVSLSSGTNVLQAYAVDTSGNPSLTNTIKFIH